MVEEEKFCGDILIQIAAARAALNSVGGLILENYMKNCIHQYLEGESEEETLNKLVEIMIKYTKWSYSFCLTLFMDLEEIEDIITPIDMAAAINSVSTPLAAAKENSFSIKCSIV